MPKNTLEDLRNHGFAALERLNDDELMSQELELNKEVSRANAIAGIMKEICLSAALEIKYQDKFNSQAPSRFFIQGGDK
jgi:hypothetical protein